MAKLFGKIALGIVGLLLLLILIMLFQPGVAVRAGTLIPFSTMLGEVDAGHVRSVRIGGHVLQGQTVDGRVFETYLPDDPALARELAAKHVEVVIGPPDDDGNPLARVAIAWLPTLILSGIWLFWLRRIAVAIARLDQTVKASGRRLADQER